jgi:hypothetical protein
MLGWNISVYRQTNEGNSPATEDSLMGTRVAIWQTGLDGLDWIQALVKDAKAIDLGGTGYPWRFTAKSEHLIPRITAGPPKANRIWVHEVHDVLGEGWEGKTVIDHDAARACRPEEWMLIEAWDES